MELNIEKKQQLEQLLVKPNLVTQDHIPFLQQLIDAFPYFQPLHLLLAKASSENENKQSSFTKAALYTNGSILHRIIHEQNFEAIEGVNVITYEPWANANSIKATVEKTADWNSKAEENIPEVAVIENLAPLPNEIIEVEVTAEHNLPKEEIPSVNTHNDFVVPEIENLEPLQGEIIKVCELENGTEEVSEADEQEVFEEINEFIAPPESIKEEATDLIEVEELQDKEEEELVIETVAATDFFAFDRNFSAETVTETEAKETEVDEVPEIVEVESPQENTVSKYDDDQLPFTFLWWLAKTRKDHEQIFRPFASPVTAAQPLQQQYVEHIFHIQAPLEPTEEEQQIVTSVPATKENEIIEAFIKNDPQIKALKPDQINTENKAKRSSEDSNDVVSETLAQIYIEQMLYHKAIDTYQKLSLKFPEKSGYFADLIQSLEKKI